MKLNSKIFDSIRVSGKRGSGPKRENTAPVCAWKGCEKPGPHRAPMGRGREGEYYNFCVDHVRQYNQSYNYFDGMSDAEVDSFRKDSLTGHRPTWKTGANAWANGSRDSSRTAEAAERVAASVRSQPRKARSSRTQPTGYRRELKPLERKALRTLDLPDEVAKGDIKTRFKELVKLHHPDANGGDSRSEEKLREIIQAYNYLKQAGMA
ncbi:MAG: DnaJ domain-containing protein [Hyphomicrobium sp.]